MLLVSSCFKYNDHDDTDIRPMEDHQEAEALGVYRALVADLNGTHGAGGFVSIDHYNPLTGDTTPVKFYNKLA